MKDRIKAWLLLIIILAGLVAPALLYAGSPPGHWMDLIKMRPTEEWYRLYGHSPITFLAYNCWGLKQLVDGQGKVIAAMKKDMDATSGRLDAIEALLPIFDPNDPNEVQ